MHRRIAPTQDRQPFFAGYALHDAFADQPLLRLDREEHHPYTVGARLRQRKTQRRAFAHIEIVRNLDQDAGAVAGKRIAAAGAAMGQIDEDLDALPDDFVRLLTLEIDNEAHPAGVMLITRVVEPDALGGGRHNSDYTKPHYHVNRILPLAVLTHLI